MQAGDTLTAKEAAYIEALEGLWDMVSDMVEGGRLREADIPDDYRALVEHMASAAYRQIDVVEEDDESS